MKKLIDLGSLAVILIALTMIGYSCLPARPAQAASSSGQFSDFPVGQARLINLTARREALEDLTPREQLDQMRDWLLFAVTSSAGLTAEGVNQALFDLPPVRHGYMQPVANFDYGDTRSCYIGNGQVIALLPADTSDERKERLARIADEQRKNLGEKPAKLVVFDYDLKLADDPSRQTAMLTRRESVNANDLFTSSAGYYEAKISNLGDLNGFMGQIDDLTYVSLKDGLTVGGRKIKGHNYRGIRIEEIAAIYQSEVKIRGSRSSLEQKIEAFNTRWSNATYSTDAEKAELEREYSQEEAALKEELAQARLKGGFVDGSGFSLDPTYDYAKLAEKFNTTIGPGIRGILSGRAHSDLLDSEDTVETPGLGPIETSSNSVEAKITRAREGLAQKNSDPLFELLGEVASKGERGAAVAQLIQQAINESYGYQAARYDGDLRGTEAGMVLFYTDLLAKLWAMNFQKSAPTGDIDEFRPMTALPVSSVYEREMEELSNTRLWFGSQDRGFQVTDKGQNMLFARTATRVYAASSNSLKPGVEAQPNASSAAFLGWWDNHYDEIARYEPEYERLNEIMKWSLVVTWLNQQEQTGKLSFLQDVPVERGYWFPDWVKQRPLRYSAWDQIGFYQRGFNNSTNEVLPRLKSDTYRQFGKEGWLVGGVSLASEKTFAKRVALSADSEVAQAARRSNLNYGPGESTSSALKTLEGATYRFSNTSAKEAVTTASAKPTAKLRGRYGEVANEPVERLVAQRDHGVNIGARVGEVPSGDLTIGNSKNGFQVGWASRDGDAGLALGRRLSGSTAPDRVLALDPNVEAAITLPGNSGYFVKLEGSQRWLKVTPESASSSLEPGYAARVGSFEARAQNYNLAWAKPEEIANRVREGGTLRLRKVTNSNDRYSMEIGKPDAAGESILIEHEGTAMRGTRDRATGDVSIAYDELPQSLRDDPGPLRRLVTEPSATGGTRYVVGAVNKSGVIEQLQTGNYRAAVRELVKAPDEFKTQLDTYMGTSLAECRTMMLNKDYGMASRRLDDLIQIYGSREELRLYKVVADLNVPPSTRNALTDLVTQHNRPTMIDELTSRLNDNLSFRHKGEAVKLSRQGDDIIASYYLNNSQGESLARGDLSRGKALIYVEDTPGLNNLDWQTSPARTLDAAISGQFKSRVIKLPRGDVARLKPAVIYDQTEGIKFNAVSTSGIGGGFRRPRYFSGGGNPGGNGGGGSGSFLPRIHTPFMFPCTDDDDNETRNDDDCDDEDKDTVIVLVRK